MSIKLQNFERIAERRVNEVIKKLHLIGNLANRNNYSYSEEHVKLIIEAIESELKLVKAKFRGEHSKGDSFTFKSSKKTKQ